MLSFSVVAKPQCNRGGHARFFTSRTVNRLNAPSLAYNHQYRANISNGSRDFLSGRERVDRGFVCRSAAPTSGVGLKASW